MRRIGEIERIKSIENMLREFKGAKIEATHGNNGDYKEMGATEPSRKSALSISIPVKLRATFDYDERTGKGTISIKDDNLGRICTHVPGLMEALGSLEEKNTN